MADTLNIVIFVTVIAIIAAWFRSREDKLKETIASQVRQAEEASAKKNPYEGLSRKTLLMTVLQEINCQPEESKDDPERIIVAYQGEHFIIDYAEESKYISIHDLWWYNAPLDDIEQLSNIRKVVNACNFDNHTTLIYTINTEENVIGVHTRQSMVFLPEIPNLKDYLASQFMDSFRQHQNFFTRLNALKGEAVPKET